MIKDGKKISNKEEYVFDDNDYLLENPLDYINKADLINYKVIYEMCTLEIEKKDDLLPKYNYETDFDEFKYLTELCK